MKSPPNEKPANCNWRVVRSPTLPASASREKSYATKTKFKDI